MRSLESGPLDPDRSIEGEEFPGAVETLELVAAPLDETDRRRTDQVPDRPRNDDLVRCRKRLEPRGRVDGHAGDVAERHLAFASVDARPDL